MLFTDIEGSTRLLKQLGKQYGELLADHRRLLREAFAAHDGHEIGTEGDSFFVTFARARDGVEAAIDGQRALAGHPWPDGVECRVRMGMHTGEPSMGEVGYHGIGVHRGARVASAAHGGQVLLSSATAELVQDDLPAGVSLLSLGEQRAEGHRPARTALPAPRGRAPCRFSAAARQGAGEKRPGPCRPRRRVRAARRPPPGGPQLAEPEPYDPRRGRRRQERASRLCGRSRRRLPRPPRDGVRGRGRARVLGPPPAPPSARRPSRRATAAPGGRARRSTRPGAG